MGRDCIVFGVILSVGMLGCSQAEKGGPGSGKEDGGETVARVSAEHPEAWTFYKQRCSICHGDSGRGEGAGAAALKPKPRDYTDVAWQKSVTDEELAKVILEGGAATGKSQLMPPSPDLRSKPEQLQALVAIIRSFAQ